MPLSRYVLGQRVDITDYQSAVAQVLTWARAREHRYVCLSNVHMVMEGHDDVEFRRIVNEADLVAPDGMPLVWALRLSGARDAMRVRGPELMPMLLEGAASAGIPVGLLGSSEVTLRTLVQGVSQRLPRLQVTFAHSPPFRPLSAEEDANLVERINASGARLLFVGLGCPKQERWMADHRGRVHAVLVGTGAAFDFLAGTKNEAPNWMQHVGLEWLHRFASEPRRLWRRYVRQNPRFLWLLGRELLGRR